MTWCAWELHFPGTAQKAPNFDYGLDPTGQFAAARISAAAAECCGKPVATALTRKISCGEIVAGREQ
jgi:hypothetical protein